jgi:hypothetical protein
MDVLFGDVVTAQPVEVVPVAIWYSISDWPSLRGRTQTPSPFQ